MHNFSVCQREAGTSVGVWPEKGPEKAQESASGTSDRLKHVWASQQLFSLVLVSHYSAIGDTSSCDARWSAIGFKGRVFLRYPSSKACLSAGHYRVPKSEGYLDRSVPGIKKGGEVTKGEVVGERTRLEGERGGRNEGKRVGGKGPEKALEKL